MTTRSASDRPGSHDDDTGPEPRDPLHLTEGADPHGEVPAGPQTDVPLLPGPSDRSPADTAADEGGVDEGGVDGGGVDGGGVDRAPGG